MVATTIEGRRLFAMIEVLMYWNNICILHKKEKEYIEQMKLQLLETGICLKTRYFGLGYGEHMAEYLAKKDAVIPDIIVSADLEVFEDERIFNKLEDQLHNLDGMVNLRECDALQAVKRDNTLLPLLAIPLVYYTKDKEFSTNSSIEEIPNLSLGGINNSAAKSVVKALWSHYDEKKVSKLLKKAKIVNMPIEAFANVQKGQSMTALVPSVYALRADNKNSFIEIPKEGVFLVPSYICGTKRLERKVIETVIQAITKKELCDFYASNGDLIVFPNSCDLKSKQEGNRYCVVDKKWFSNIKARDFYQLYKKYIPTAIEP